MSIKDDNWWTVKVSEYREDPVVEASLRSAKKFKADLSLIKELSGYFPYMEDADTSIRQIQGPADLSVGLEVSARLLSIKDRSSYISLVYTNHKSKLERLHSIVRSHLFSKREVMGLKNDAQRQSIVSLTCPEIEDALIRISRILDAAQRVVLNANQSFNILRVQVDILKELRYEAGLTKAMRGQKLATEL
tara:strand:- start:30 stop:602 length:573 start_codon:yes stop_codon:yes gene_type:complete